MKTRQFVQKNQLIYRYTEKDELQPLASSYFIHVKIRIYLSGDISRNLFPDPRD